MAVTGFKDVVEAFTTFVTEDCTDGAGVFAVAGLLVDFVFVFVGTVADTVVETFTDGVERLADGVETFTDGTATFTDGVETFTDGIATLPDGTLPTTVVTVADVVAMIVVGTFVGDVTASTGSFDVVVPLTDVVFVGVVAETVVDTFSGGEALPSSVDSVAEMLAAIVFEIVVENSTGRGGTAVESGTGAGPVVPGPGDAVVPAAPSLGALACDPPFPAPGVPLPAGVPLGGAAELGVAGDEGARPIGLRWLPELVAERRPKVRGCLVSEDARRGNS